MTEVTIDAERQEQARRYARIQRRLMVVDLLIGTICVVAWLVFGVSSIVKNSLISLTENEWLLVAGFGFIFGAGMYLLDLPLSFYSGYSLPHRFGLSNQTLVGWISDQVKSLLIGGVIGGFILEVVYALLRASPDLWWLWVAGFLLLFSVILANLAPVILLPIFYKLSPLGEEHADLSERLLHLSEKAGAHVRGVYRFDMSRRTKAANAALTGLGNTRRILLGDTLLDEFTPDEIGIVLAHELGHHVNKDVPMGIAIESVTTLVGLWLASLLLEWGVGLFGFEGVADVAGMPFFALVMGIYGLVTMPLGNAYSRWRERRADAYALRATGKGDAYASALARLANQNLAEADPEPWVEFLLYSHPALSKRIAFARSQGNGRWD